MKGIKTTYYSYGNIYKSTAEIFCPATIQELRSILNFCQQKNRKITLAGNFNSFDRQNAGKDVVISMKAFNTIEFNATNHTIKVGAGARWGAIFDVVYANKCALFTCITGSEPTAAGTLSVNSNSVWTPSTGKEGDHCLEIEVMTTNGELLTCSRTQHSDLFYGVIGGLGYLGFIVSITYKVFYVGSDYEMVIDAIDYDDIEQLEQRLHLRKSPKLEQLEDIKSQSTLFYTDNGKPKFSIYNRTYKRINKHKKTNKIAFGFAVLASGIIRFIPSLANWAVKKDTHKLPSKRTLIKHIHTPKYGLFWAQPDYNWSKKFSRFFQRLGYEPKLYQNSYFIPEGGDKVTTFTKRVHELILEYNLQSFMFDILYIPKDEPFVLSPAQKSGGFYVNTTFMEKTNRDSLMLVYKKLNQMAFEMGGSLNLAKNCFIEPSLMESMYQEELKKFSILKEKYDPNKLITSDFFELYFPSLSSSKPKNC